MKKSVITIQPFVITTIIVYALFTTVFFEMDNAFGGETYFVLDEKNNESDKKTMMTSDTQQKVETKECKSPCPSSVEMCIEICA